MTQRNTEGGSGAKLCTKWSVYYRVFYAPDHLPCLCRHFTEQLSLFCSAASKTAVGGEEGNLLARHVN